jgi:uncharacterized protein (TIGR02466 family)
MTTPQSVLAPARYFASMIYTIQKPEFLDDVKAVSDELLEASKKAMPMNETYPFMMTGSMIGAKRTKAFEQFIAESAWIILDSQGYNLDVLGAFVSEMWAQEHFKYSGMEQHVHSHGVVLSGFYFTTAPEDGCMIELHDPRPGKVQASLPLKDASQVRDANNSLFIKPKAGMMIFSNSWLPHSFTRNSTNESVKFVHFNVSVRPIEHQSAPIIV